MHAGQGTLGRLCRIRVMTAIKKPADHFWQDGASTEDRLKLQRSEGSSRLCLWNAFKSPSLIRERYKCWVWWVDWGQKQHFLSKFTIWLLEVILDLLSADRETGLQQAQVDMCCMFVNNEEKLLIQLYETHTHRTITDSGTVTKWGAMFLPPPWGSKEATSQSSTPIAGDRLLNPPCHCSPTAEARASECVARSIRTHFPWAQQSSWRRCCRFMERLAGIVN